MTETNEQRAYRWYNELKAIDKVNQRYKLAETFFKELVLEQDDRIVIASLQTVIKAFEAPDGGMYVPTGSYSKYFGKITKRYADRLLQQEPELMALVKECKENGFNNVKEIV